jgi:hypothetical protein
MLDAIKKKAPRIAARRLSGVSPYLYRSMLQFTPATIDEPTTSTKIGLL